MAKHVRRGSCVRVYDVIDVPKVAAGWEMRRSWARLERSESAKGLLSYANVSLRHMYTILFDIVQAFVYIETSLNLPSI